MHTVGCMHGPGSCGTFPEETSVHVSWWTLGTPVHYQGDTSAPGEG